LQVYPALRLFWFIFCCINIACPPSLNLIGEIIIIPALISFSYLILVCIGLIIFFRAGYNIYLYSSINHGSFSSYFVGGIPIKSYIMIGLLRHGIPLILVIKSSLFIYLQKTVDLENINISDLQNQCFSLSYSRKSLINKFLQKEIIKRRQQNVSIRRRQEILNDVLYQSDR
jgi:NADH:ubiquinone oxidoreductase subunit 4 (subunit M)